MVRHGAMPLKFFLAALPITHQQLICTAANKKPTRIIDHSFLYNVYRTYNIIINPTPSCNSMQAALRSLSLTTTIAEALFALKNSDDNFLSVWSCEHTAKTNKDYRGNCEEDGCDVVTSLVKIISLISLLDAIDIILQGARNLVVHKGPDIAPVQEGKQQQKLSITSPTIHNAGNSVLANTGRT
ncbi:hypothetical protein NC653_027947 [Populus alba x Populus x berolinensis]|uniref:Uncharacterized protein n=1 Tax=Populus alba x Populus x berolinensis TaxID=444605 RepID=A0AAD6Q6S5_9ROSI|nr:hypothetical protein NC653_027947 [Populus alba x Populus x berolinensis]